MVPPRQNHCHPNAGPFGIEQLTDLLADGEVREAVKLARLFETRCLTSVPMQGPRGLGVWSYSEEGEQYVRDEAQRPQWFSWAQVPRFSRRKGTRYRIVLLGESVARGFLYDASFSPAVVLQKTLAKFAGDSNYVEVIDLAKLRMGLEIRELARAAMDLSPDLLIVFAGNNWFPLTPEFMAERKLEAYSALRRNGVAGLARMAAENIEENARECVAGIRDICSEHHVPVIWIVPEFNLADWEDQATPPTGICAAAVTQWYRLHAQAQHHLKCGARDLAVAAAEQMLCLDEGRSGVAYRVIARAALAADPPDVPVARRYLELCRDVALFQPVDSVSSSPFFFTPRCFRVVADVLTAQVAWSDVVDLREVFGSLADTALPDRRLFLDYCHMTSRGIRLAMCATAKRVWRIFAEEDVPIERFEALCPSPDPRVEAEAALLAAIENAHYAQSQEVCSYFCARALAHDESILPPMCSMARMYLHDIPCVLSSEYQTLRESPYPNLAPFVARLGHPRASSRLARAIHDATVAARHEPPSLDALVHEALGSAQNLLGFFLATESLPPHECTWIEAPYKARRSLEATRDYFVSHSPLSHFRFWHDGSSGGVLTLVVRRPGCEPGEEILEVSLNHRRSGTLPLRPQWMSARIEMPKDGLAQGWNDVRLHWPPAPYGEPDTRAMASRILEQGGVPDIYPGWGHVFELNFTSLG